MVANKILAIAVASALLIGGVASVSAAPAEMMSDESDNAPVDVPDEGDVPDNTTHDVPVDDAENVSDERPDHAGPGNERAANASENRPGEVGPSDGLPEQVPDHVSEIHDRISAFLDGSLSNLGDALSSLLGDDADAEDDSDEADEDAEEADEADDEEETDDSEEDDDSDEEDMDADDDEDGEDTTADAAAIAA